MNSLFLTGISLAILSTCTPQEKATTLQDVANTTFSAGLGYLTGGPGGAVTAAGPAVVTDVQDAAYALRTLENPASPAVPSAATINATLAAVTASPAVTKALGPKVAAVVAAAAKSGIAPSASLEQAAVSLDRAAVTPAAIAAASGAAVATVSATK